MKGFFPFVDVDELEGPGVDLGVVGERKGTARLSGD